MSDMPSVPSLKNLVQSSLFGENSNHTGRSGQRSSSNSVKPYGKNSSNPIQAILDLRDPQFMGVFTAKSPNTLRYPRSLSRSWNQACYSMRLKHFIVRSLLYTTLSIIWFCTRPRLRCKPNPAKTEADLTIFKPNSYSYI